MTTDPVNENLNSPPTPRVAHDPARNNPWGFFEYGATVFSGTVWLRADWVAPSRVGGEKRVAFRERCGKGSRAGNGVRTGASIGHRPILFDISTTAANEPSGHGCRHLTYGAADQRGVLHVGRRPVSFDLQVTPRRSFRGDFCGAALSSRGGTP